MPILRGLPVDFLNKFFIFPARLGARETPESLISWMAIVGAISSKIMSV